MNAQTRYPNPRSRLLLTEIELLGWLGQAVPEDALEYHRGFLALDRVPIGRDFSETDAQKLSRVAVLALRAAEIGIAHLVQRRLGPDDFSYVIVAREKMPGAVSALLEINLVGGIAQIPRTANEGELSHAA